MECESRRGTILAMQREDRTGWTGGIARDHDEMEAIDTDWWRSLEPEDRWAVALELSLSFDWTLLDEAPEGIRGSTFGIRSLRS